MVGFFSVWAFETLKNQIILKRHITPRRVYNKLPLCLKGNNRVKLILLLWSIVCDTLENKLVELKRLEFQSD